MRDSIILGGSFLEAPEEVAVIALALLVVVRVGKRAWREFTYPGCLRSCPRHPCWGAEGPCPYHWGLTWQGLERDKMMLRLGGKESEKREDFVRAPRLTACNMRIGGVDRFATTFKVSPVWIKGR